MKLAGSTLFLCFEPACLIMFYLHVPTKLPDADALSFVSFPELWSDYLLRSPDAWRIKPVLSLVFDLFILAWCSCCIKLVRLLTFKTIPGLLAWCSCCIKLVQIWFQDAKVVRMLNHSLLNCLILRLSTANTWSLKRLVLFRDSVLQVITSDCRVAIADLLSQVLSFDSPDAHVALSLFCNCFETLVTTGMMFIR